jgi:hypothetical protein
MTGLPVDHRFENHKNGYKSARRLFSDPTREFYVRELARLTTFALGTVQQELAK